MKFTLSWLKEYLETELSEAEICCKLSNIGLEVENIESQAKNLDSFFVAKIITAQSHPESTKLQICQVDIGGDRNLQIICGAKNAREGLKVAYAPIGSVIPANGMKIKKAKIAGTESNGMLCSSEELGLSKVCMDNGGIIEIDNQFAIRTKISQVFGLDDTIFDINITPNRGDCLGVFGVARDLAASGAGTLKTPETKAIKGGFVSPIGVKIESSDCPYFAGFYIKNVKNRPSPKWLKERLESVGCNSINAIVDITNYVMLCLNQPLHSYDADKLSGDIIVRGAISGEKFMSLKKLEYQLLGNELVIANDDKIVGLAGIIGGLETAVFDETQNIFLEGAFFDAKNIANTGRGLNILSDARYRFERVVDLGNIKNALLMAANLILEVCGGKISEIVEAGSNVMTNTTIKFDLTQIKKIIGIEIKKSFIIETLKNLRFGIKELNKDLLEIEIPSHRSDIKIVRDLIEEVIRIYGLNNIISQPLLIKNKGHIHKSTTEIVSKKLFDLGFTQTINYSFIDQKLAALFADFNAELRLQNPISKQMNYMRPSLLVGLLQNITKNQARGFADLSFFEAGKVFLGTKPNQQKEVVAGVRIGKNKPVDHYGDRRNFDVFDVKKDTFDCLEGLKFSARSFQLEEGAPCYYHPYRSKIVKLGKKIVGYFGELHPLVTKKLDIKGIVNAFELLIEELPNNLDKKNIIKPFVASDFLPVNRDFAFIVDKDIIIGDLLKKIGEVDRSLIVDVNLFDIYQDPKLGEGKKSIALSIKIQPIEKTLTGKEIDNISNKIIKMVEEIFFGSLR